ncbi:MULTISPECIES: LysR substrate-binding domain-containing protein [Methylobacterium]|jgi:DNA-binding transcriptional LysR family regulator|uniref:DNA-binding transcriptional regulator, LysR family n=2 Tax=Methylobacterium TaxID=407 RepID=A0AAE8L8D3_9HYPH|nr:MULTISPECIES: LysR substrate-binding domain-containing protein [Methylobacterium]AIQ88139.1 LysR family transcriptional regulator [Methylobacterium oryzae CBMB20]APT34667.1 HTH-type transcriptional activator AllS [Methylobacterium phyllosphaerae]AWV14083.1 LysR family transcriptional regulator [Methylobacterium sp. XJLW]MDE4909366.1 LysR substrate-binding domain-containing protein [Methylobacterium sp. 092160098-2]SFH37909.1 DNA-binding transcriptional regulator, LysR family [Methylobacteri
MPGPPLPFDLDLLRTFVAIVDNGSFTRAAQRLSLTQSTVSLQIKRLEDGLARRLFDRDGRDLQLTPEGEILLTYARQILQLGAEALSRLRETDVSGVVRLGTPEDFATTHLSEVLACFARTHPQVALQVQCDFTVNLLADFAKGRYDLILFKREPQGPSGGTKVWREVLDWVASPRLVTETEGPIPLILAPAPDVYRKRALSALDAAGRDWRIVYTSPSLAGLQAAVQAGLGVTVLPTEMIPADMVSVSARLQLPKLPDTEIVLYRAPGHVTPAAELLSSTIIAALEQRVVVSKAVAV